MKHCNEHLPQRSSLSATDGSFVLFKSHFLVFLFIISVLFSAAGTALNFVVLVSVTVTTL